jgi:hypothetical protein
MNYYYQARQRTSDGRWDYTNMNDGRVWPIGYCGGEGGGHHATEMEARECYTKYLLDTRTNFDRKMQDQKLRCEVCGEFTDGVAEVGHASFVLCDQHRTREHSATLLGTVNQITSSY